MLHVHYWRAAILTLTVIAVGCSKEDLTGAFDKAASTVTENMTIANEAVKDKMQAAKGEVQEQLNLAGSIELTAGELITTKACYVSLIPQGSGRDAVLQLQSYRDAEAESFPSVFVRAHVEFNTIAPLVNKPFKARLFVQREAQGPILFSEVATPIELTITSVEDKLVSFKLTDTQLRDSLTGGETPVTGSMTGVLQ